MAETWPVRVAIRQAFTLIELLVVIAIIAILAAIIVPAVVSVQRTANVAKDLEQVRGLGNGFTLYYKKYSFFPALTDMSATGVTIGTARTADAAGSPGEPTTSLKLLMTEQYITDAKIFFSPREPAPDDKTLAAMQKDLNPKVDPTWASTYAYDAGHNPGNGITPFFGNRRSLIVTQLLNAEPCHVLTCDLTAKEIAYDTTGIYGTSGYGLPNIVVGSTATKPDDIYADDSTTLGFRDSFLADSTVVSLGGP
ncbi:MAG: prepilin-type N-terminal cleavage/methylation domain-containing protein [Planctomycetota bacterium]